MLQRQTLQTGAPTKTEYVDRLGRVIATGVEGFDGKEVISKVDYNARGAKIAEHQPMSTGLPAGAWNGTAASPFMTRYSGFDALGRAATKTVIRSSSPDLFEPGKGTASLVTDYIYAVAPAGIKTSITVHTPTSASGQITMSRTYDPRGKLVEAVQDVSSPTAHSITTTYSYDPAGSLLVITDSKGNPLKAEYDDLGRKTKVDDPDRGTWSYTWDGLGRVRTQKDARGITLAYQYDAIGRMERRFMQQSAAGPWLLEANWQYDLNGKMGTLGAMLGVQDTLAGTLVGAQPASYFHREYQYDSLLRPWSVATHIPGGGTSGSNTWTAHDFVTESGYDRNYGRLKAMKYPSGEIVSLDYDARGNPLGEAQLAADGSRGLTYRHVDEMSVRGQVTMQTLGNNVVETNTYDDSTGMPLAMNAFKMRDPQPAGRPNPPVPDQLVQQVDYRYDHFLNVARQEKQFLQRSPTTKALVFSGCQPVGATAVETYSYDELQRLLGASRSWTGMTANGSTVAADVYTYDDLGNIKGKSDYGDTYTYGTSARALPSKAGPHAVALVTKSGVSRPAFQYDDNGNMTSGDGRTVVFDNLDRAITVTANGYTKQFRYAPDGQRYVQSAYFAGATTNEYYEDKLYERVESASSPKERTYVSSEVMIVRTGASREVRYRHLDRLGSLDAVTKQDGSEDPTDAHGYDAFGKPRARDFQSSADISTWQMQPGDNVYTTERGFTGHEHLDDLYLIHMNGRVYDYRLGRFLSVDPIISNPANSQSINPYSYIGNNPLSGVDPTGYCAVGMASELGSHVCRLTQEGIADKIGAAIANGSITMKTAVADIAHDLKASMCDVQSAIAAHATQFASALGLGNGGGSQGSNVANANANTEGSPAQNATATDGASSKGWWQRIKDWFRETDRKTLEGMKADQQRQNEEVARKLLREGKLDKGDDGTLYLMGAGPIGRMLGPELDPAKTPVYRGGETNIGPDDIKLNADGTVKHYGPSLGTDADALGARYGSVRQIESIPNELQIRQTGKNPTHYEIVPRNNSMTKREFLELLGRVRYKR